MNRTNLIRFVSPLLLLLSVGVAGALVMTSDHGEWPSDWPKELEPLRASARTIEVAAGNQENIYEIRFSDQAVFEKAWPIIVGLKTPGSPLTLTACKPASDPAKAGVSIIDNTLPIVRIYAPATERVGQPIPAWPKELIGPKGELPEYVQKVMVDGKQQWVDVEKLSNKESGFHECARIDLEMVVDGKVIDLNRIPLPGNTPMIDRRF